MKHDHRSGPLDASALHLLHRAGQCAEVLFTNEATKADLTPRQFAVLVCVAQNPDVSQTGLVEQTGVDRSTLADVVRRLVKKGLLQRKRTRRDARMYAVRLTAKGQSILNSVKPLASKVDQRILSVLRSDQRGSFIRFPWRDREGHDPLGRAGDVGLQGAIGASRIAPSVTLDHRTVQRAPLLHSTPATRAR